MNNPILYFAFNRPSHTKQSLDSLITNEECKLSDFYVFIDGPRNEEDQIKIYDVINIVKSYQPFFKSFQLQVNTFNKGCAQQVIDTLNEFCKSNNFIYLEDDCMTSPYFLKFINEGLKKYNDNLNVKSIADTFKINYFPTKAFLRTGILGFGSWSRVWKELT